MGKASKKMKRQQKRRASTEQMKQCAPMEQELDQLFTAEAYEKVLEKLAQLIQSGDIKPDLLYKGAYSYFMLGDYERAAEWVSNTLNYAPLHIDARILLARICFRQDRPADGLALYEFLLEHVRGTMTAEQEKQIEDSSEYYVRRDRDQIRQKFPQLAEFLMLGEDSAQEEKKGDAEKSGTSDGSDTLAALRSLKQKLQHAAAETSADSAPDVRAEPKKENDAAEPAEGSGGARDKIAEIQVQQISLREKVRLLNRFAGAEYLQGRYRQAAEFLTAALELDCGDVPSLRNMAMAQAALGDNDKAQSFAAQLPDTDFVLLKQIRDMTE